MIRHRDAHLLKACAHLHACILVLVTDLFFNVKPWEQPAANSLGRAAAKAVDGRTLGQGVLSAALLEPEIILKKIGVFKTREHNVQYILLLYRNRNIVYWHLCKYKA